MALTPRLELRQSQTLVMTPQLQQAIKLLQLSNIELAEYVEAEVEKNPLLELAEPGEPGEANGADGDRVEEAAPRDEGILRAADEMLEASGAPSGDDMPLDTSFENVFDADRGGDAAPAETGGEQPDLSANWMETRSRGGAINEDASFEATLSEGVTLKMHLEQQLHLAVHSPMDRLIGNNLIDLVNESGYLTEDVGIIADRLGAPIEDVERVLDVVQCFDPPGVAARNLRECLARQLKEKDRLDPIMDIFLDHLDLLAKADLAGLKRICGVDNEDLAEMIADIRSLNPKPGLAFGDEPIQPVTPDVFLRVGADGGWHIELNSETLPRVLVNSRYSAAIGRSAKDAKVKAFITDCLNSANWLVKALDQRARTILKVATEIVRQQDGFFAHGVTHLRPLNLRAIAEAIEMHESTVSRVTANKYLACSRGVFEMKYFFTSAIPASGGGDAHSAEAVRFRIKELIDGEKPDDILSDDTIVEVLRKQDIEIARRTVAKYREAMNIPSSVQRRRAKNPKV